MTTVELHTAFFWVCDECGVDNFERGIAVAPEELTAEDLEAFDEETRELALELEKAHATIRGDWIRKPDQVRCRSCGEAFEVEHP